MSDAPDAGLAIRALRLLGCPNCRRLHPLKRVEGGLERGPCPDREAGEPERERPLLLARSPDPTIFAYLTNAEDGSLRFGALRIPEWVLALIAPAMPEAPGEE